MSDELFMSPEVYREHEQEITAAVRVLLQDPVSRRRFEVAAIYTAKGHEQLAIFLRTNFGIVAVLNWWTPEGAHANRMSTASDRTRGERAKALLATNFFRTHEHGLVIWPLTGKCDEDLMLTSRSRREPYFVLEEDILRRIERKPYEDGREFRHCDGLVFG